MSEFALTIAGFTVCGGFIFFSGKYLSKYGDIIADHLGLGKAWIGMILMASVTSLPELTVASVLLQLFSQQIWLWVMY